MNAKLYYQAVIVDQSSWQMDGQPIMKARCGHEHRTPEAANRCLQSLAKWYPDGTHNGWAHFGVLRAHHPEKGWLRVETTGWDDRDRPDSFCIVD